MGMEVPLAGALDWSIDGEERDWMATEMAVVLLGDDSSICCFRDHTFFSSSKMDTVQLLFELRGLCIWGSSPPALWLGWLCDRVE